jgi:MFS family permease
LAVGGILIGTLGGLILHLLPGTLLMLLSATGFLTANLLFVLTPDKPNYWAWIMPAMICATIGVDIMFNVSNIYLTTNIPADQQGLAGAFINAVLFLGMSFVLGFADYAVVTKADLGLKESYNMGFWLGVGAAGVAILIVLLFTRIGKAKSELTFDEKEQLREEMLRSSLRGRLAGDVTADDGHSVEVVHSVEEKAQSIPKNN